ncbi:MAG: single-stranded DNA-binding protein [Candidatus Nephthysia bennettiae]|uniref:RNA-binding protein KhpB n=1 Tax=Candidatus Nephthysia bennettiae TaxID=3127016 RepID=A0A934K8Q9_9BACT|nr:KH domain-containing protein [Candidatus Dormibacteraeota bacterium]MBJ7612347.1 KH domain-containing protein [Candidatus Dormibacteraeota bacterium]PZR92344.1 MAG: single-stranded DNA-binding protein [Candidatus Dormibacteraeota bacterium]
MKTAEGRGRTLDEAVDAALIQLAESRRNVDVKVLSETPEETIVEVTVIGAETPSGAAASGAGAGAVAVAAGGRVSAEATRGAADGAKEIVDQLLTRMGIRCQVSSRATPEAILVDVSGRDLGVLIGWRGETLRALQTMTNLLASRKLGPDQRVIVDVERYRQRREHTVKEIAYRAARQVKVTGDPITLDAMQPFERRAIHLALEADPDVTTISIGEEPDRRVVVGPKRAEQPA